MRKFTHYYTPLHTLYFSIIMRLIGSILTIIAISMTMSTTAAHEHVRLLSADELYEQCAAQCQPPHVKKVRTTMCKQYAKMRPQPKVCVHHIVICGMS